MTNVRRVVGLVIAMGVLATGTALRAQERRPDRDQKREKEKEVKLAVKLDDKLKFMAGCWQGRLDPETVVEEIWTNPTENLLTSTTRYIRKNRATSFEMSRILATDSAVTFSASTEGRAFDTYTMTQLVREFVQFENPKKAFPQKISYRLASDGSLIPRNEGEGETAVELRFKKVKCPGV